MSDLLPAMNGRCNMFRRVQLIALAVIVYGLTSPAHADEQATETESGGLTLPQTWTFNVGKLLSKDFDRLTKEGDSATWKDGWKRVQAQVSGLELEITDTLRIETHKTEARPTLSFVDGQTPRGRVVLVISERADQITDVPIILVDIGPTKDVTGEGGLAKRHFVVTLEWQAGEKTGVRDGLLEAKAYAFESFAITLNAKSEASASPIPNAGK